MVAAGGAAERVVLPGGAELWLDDRLGEHPPGWLLREPGRDEPRPVRLDEALARCGPDLAAHLTSLTVALICELHVRAIVPASFDTAPPEALRSAKFRLVEQVAGAMGALAGGGVPLRPPAPGG